jgi:hypothetical protein
VAKIRYGAPYWIDRVPSSRRPSYPRHRGRIDVDETGTVTLGGVRGKLGQIPLEFLGTVTASRKGPLLDLTVVAPDVELGPAARAFLDSAWQAAYGQFWEAYGDRL